MIYYFVVSKPSILLLFAYAKNVQGDLTAQQTKQLTTLVRKEFP